MIKGELTTVHGNAYLLAGAFGKGLGGIGKNEQRVNGSA